MVLIQILKFHDNRIISLLGLAVLVTFGCPLLAQNQTNSYCAASDTYAPDGIIIRMGKEYYRTCDRWVENDRRLRQFWLKINPLIIEQQVAEVADLNLHFSTRLRIEENVHDVDGLRNAIRNFPIKGTRKFGNAIYTSYESRPLGANDRPNAGAYLYKSHIGGSISAPAHWVLCIGWNHSETFPAPNCNLSLKRSSVTASVFLLGRTNSKAEYINYFAEIADTIQSILDIANVTDGLENYRGILEIVE